jgi:hypothetical protein
MLFGSARGMIRAGRPSAGIALHWVAVVILLLLGLWGWINPVLRNT